MFERVMPNLFKNIQNLPYVSFGFTERSLLMTSNMVFKKETEPIYPAGTPVKAEYGSLIRNDRD